jgi:hypothetical protein
VKKKKASPYLFTGEIGDAFVVTTILCAKGTLLFVSVILLFSA